MGIFPNLNFSSYTFGISQMDGLRRHLVTWQLSPARCIELAMRQQLSGAIARRSTGFSQRLVSRLTFLNCGFHLAFSSTASHSHVHLSRLSHFDHLNLWLFPTEHQCCRVSITGPIHQRRRLILSLRTRR